MMRRNGASGCGGAVLSNDLRISLMKWVLLTYPWLTMEDAEDIVSQAFLVFLEKVHESQGLEGAPVSRGGVSFLRGIARNLVRRETRRRSTASKHAPSVWGIVIADSDGRSFDSGGSSEPDHAQIHLEAYFARFVELSPMEQIVLIQHFLGYTPAEIARMSGSSRASVYKLREKAVRKMSEVLELSEDSDLRSTFEEHPDLLCRVFWTLNREFVPLMLQLTKNGKRLQTAEKQRIGECLRDIIEEILTQERHTSQ